MSDAHHEHDGGHELEALDAGHLLRVIGGLTLVVFISIIAVIQWFHKQQAELRLTQSDYSFLAEHRAGEAKLNEGIEAVAERMAKDPALLVAAPAPEGWIHPDDIGGGAGAGAAAGAGDDAADPSEGAAAGGHDAGTPEGDEGAEAPENDEGAATEGEGAAGEAAAPAGDKPAETDGEDNAEDSDQGSEDDADE